MPGTRLGPAGGEHGVAGDVDGLLADLHHAAHHDVVDDRRVDAGALDERVQRLGGEVDRMPVLQLAVAPAERCADGIDDHCVRHGNSLEDSDRIQLCAVDRSLQRRRPELKPEHP